jgi:hypothetical protein
MSDRLPTLYSEIERLEKEIRSHEDLGILVDAPPPVIEWYSGDATRPPRISVSGVAAMHSGILIVYLRDLDIQEQDKGPALVISEERSYSAILQGHAIIVRLDSGHISHSHAPHLHTAFTDIIGIDPPPMPLTYPIELGNFIARMEDWRMENHNILPIFPASVANARLP